MQNRLQYIDLSKGILIFLVCLGHAIQYTATEKNYLDNLIWQTIYAFHMPLFMILSGWFFKVDKWSNTPLQIAAKTTRLIVPIFSFNLIIWTIQVVFGTKEISSFLDWMGCDTFYLFAMRYWFLMALFVIYIIILLLKLTIHNNIVIMAICVISGFIIKPLGKYYIGFMLPYFFMGYLLNTYKNIWMQHDHKLLTASGMLFFIMMLGWRGEWTIYYTELRCISSGQMCWHNLLVGIYRFVIGAAGSWFIIIGMMSLSQKIARTTTNILTALGSSTLGIYMCQTVFFEAYLSKQNFALVGQKWIIASFILSVVVCGICYVLNRLLQQSKWTNILFLGGYKWKHKYNSKVIR